MRDLLANLGGVALFALPGLALTGFFPGLRSLPFLRRLGYGYLLGVALLAGSLYVLSAVFELPLRRPAVLATAAVLGAAGLAAWARNWRRGLRPRARRRGRWMPLSAAVLTAAAAVSLGVFAEAVSEPLQGWDDRMHWSAQARYIRQEGSVLPLALVKRQWFIHHPRYPVLLPVAQAAVLEAAGAGEDEMFFRGLYAAFLPALLLVVYDGARRAAGRLPALLTVATAAGLPLLTFGSEGGAVSAYSDLPLACFYGAALVLLLRGRARTADGVAAGLLLGAAVLTKSEGAILAGAAVAAAAVPLLVGLRRRFAARALRLGAAAAFPLAALLFLQAWRSRIPNRHDEMYSRFLTADHLWPEALTRIPEVAAVVLEQTFAAPGHWLAFWWAAALVLYAGRGVLKRRRAALGGPLLLAAAAPLAVAWGAYSVHWEPLGLARVTWGRFLLQAAVPLLLLFALALREVLRRSPIASRLAHLSH